MAGGSAQGGRVESGFKNGNSWAFIEWEDVCCDIWLLQFHRHVGFLSTLSTFYLLK